MYLNFIQILISVVDTLNAITHFFIRKYFLLSTEAFTFSQFQYQNFLKIFLANIFEFQYFAHAN